MAERIMNTKRQYFAPAIDMTPMIDCVFQLLIFFIIALKPEDIIAHLDIVRPTLKPDQEVTVDHPIAIAIMRDGITIDDKPVSMKALDTFLAKMAALSTTQTILIKCAGDSKHDKLVAVLDVCSHAGLNKLSVMSL